MIDDTPAPPWLIKVAGTVRRSIPWLDAHDDAPAREELEPGFLTDPDDI